jgi:hypothetical protein
LTQCTTASELINSFCVNQLGIIRYSIVEYSTRYCSGADALVVVCSMEPCMLCVAVTTQCQTGHESLWCASLHEGQLCLVCGMSACWRCARPCTNPAECGVYTVPVHATCLACNMICGCHCLYHPCLHPLETHSSVLDDGCEWLCQGMQCGMRAIKKVNITIGLLTQLLHQMLLTSPGQYIRGGAHNVTPSVSRNDCDHHPSP